jgi:hypothetical protein
VDDTTNFNQLFSSIDNQTQHHHFLVNFSFLLLISININIMCNSIGNICRLAVVVASLAAVSGWILLLITVLLLLLAHSFFFYFVGLFLSSTPSSPPLQQQQQQQQQLACHFLVMFNCDFIQFGSANYASIGLWFYGVDGTCEDEELSLEAEGWYTGAWIKASRGCLTLSMFCGAGATGMVILEWLCCEICCAGLAEGLAYAGAWMLGL